jgi:hypothetical protein
MTTHRLHAPAYLLLGVLTASATLARPTLAQEDSACTWDRCALRVQHRTFGGPRLVRGSDGVKVAGLGWFPPALPFLAQRSDSAAVHYDAFRARHTAGNVLVLVAMGAFIAGYAIARDGNDGAGAAVLIGGLTVGLVGVAVTASGQNELSRAVWWYNRSLVVAGLPPNRRLKLTGPYVRVGMRLAAW